MGDDSSIAREAVSPANVHLSVNGEIVASIGLIILVFLGLVFLTSGISKLAIRRRFEQIVAEYKVLPSPMVRPIAFWLPFVELVTGFICIAGVLAGAGVAIALLAIFSGAVAWNLLHGRRDFDCGCLGQAPAQAISWFVVGRNLALATLGLVAVLLSGFEPLRSEWTSMEGGVAGSLAVVLTATSGLLALLFWTEVGSLVGATRGVRSA